MPAQLAEGWTIQEWSRERGRGVIVSAQLGALAFDAACAEVDDFETGERVGVELVADGSSFRFTRIWPASARLAGSAAEAALAPPLDAQLERNVRKAIEGMAPREDYRLRELNEDHLLLEGDDSSFEYGHTDELELIRPTYVELPLRFGCQAFRLATRLERKRVADRTEVTPGLAVFTFVEDADTFYFVVGEGVRWRRSPRPGPR